MDDKFTNGELIDLYNSLEMLNDLSGSKFVFALDINMSRLETEIKSLNKAIEPSKEYKKFEQEKEVINQNFAEKDEKNNPVKEAVDGSGLFRYIINPERKKEYDEAMAELMKEYDEAIQKRKKSIAEYRELLDSENDSFKPHKIPIDFIPEDITWEQYKIIKKLIKK